MPVMRSSNSTGTTGRDACSRSGRIATPTRAAPWAASVVAAASAAACVVASAAASAAEVALAAVEVSEVAAEASAEASAGPLAASMPAPRPDLLLLPTPSLTTPPLEARRARSSMFAT